MPVCIQICFKEWGQECAMHFRPRCVCGIVYAFRWGGLRVNGYLVCVGCVEKYNGGW